jgi:hypothetical protein
MLPRDLGEALADLLQGKRVIAEQAPVAVRRMRSADSAVSS